MTRSHLSRIAVAAILALAPLIAAAQKGPIKIGGLFEMTGLFSPNAQEALQGMQLYFDEIGYTVARLDTGPRQTRAQRMYERAGYVPIANFNGNPVASFFGEKRL